MKADGRIRKSKNYRGDDQPGFGISRIADMRYGRKEKIRKAEKRTENRSNCRFKGRVKVKAHKKGQKAF